MKNKIKLNLRNKKAFFNYDIIDELSCGIVLYGTEVKSIVKGNLNFNDSYCNFIDNELWLKNFHINSYENASHQTHEPKRDRKLLLTKVQLNKFRRNYEEKGLTIVPLNIYINERGLIKMNIGLARGKKKYDKKKAIIERDDKIRIKREFNINI